MSGKESQVKLKMALLVGTIPSAEEVDQLQFLSDQFDVCIVSSESICGYLGQVCRSETLKFLALPDYDENPTYIPGLENALTNFDVVLVKERLGLYAYQAVKAKWRKPFRLFVWVDNAAAYPAEDIGQMRTIRAELARGCDGFIVQSKASKEALILEGISYARIHTIRAFCEQVVERTPSSKAEARVKLGLNEGDFVVAYLGQIEWEESLFDLASAAKLAIANPGSMQRRLKLLFCGIGQAAADLKERLHMMGLGQRTVFVAPSRAAHDAIFEAADCQFISPWASRDRVDADPYRVLTAMANGIPIIAPRATIIEELCGKHRIDYCHGSVESLMKALQKAESGASLLKNIVQKNQSQVSSRFSKATVSKEMSKVFGELAKQQISVISQDIDHQVLEVESKVYTKQYIPAIEMIGSLFQRGDLPHYHEANLYRLIGDCFTKLGDTDQGKKSYTQAVELDPYSAKSYIGLGTVALTRSSFDLAIFNFQKAVSLAPRDEMASLGLGLAFQGIQELAEANTWVVKSLDINPENTAAIFTLVKLAHERDNYNDAIKGVRKYLELHPHDHNMLYTLGGLLFKVGQYHEVIDVADKITEIDPIDERALALRKQAERAKNGKAGVVGGKA